MPAQTFPTTYGLSEFTENNTSVVGGQFSIVYENQIDKGEAVALGRGAAQNQLEAEGRLFGQFEQSGAGAGADGTVISEGKIRLSIRTRQDRLVAVINEYDVDEIQSGEAASDRTDRHPFARQYFAGGNRWVAYPYKLCIEFKLPDAYDVDTADSSLKADGLRAESTS